MNARDTYRRQRLENADPGELIVMLYDGILRFMEEAARALSAGDPKGTGEKLGRALDIVAYLQSTLRASVAPELVKSLDNTYFAWSMLMLRAQAERDVTILERVRTQVDEMRETWVEAILKARAEKQGSSPQAAGGVR
ncbi:MAG: flagellar export chaperone FliS [Deltaproteobacteria bacterium]|nr:flagellar export chaperone FliS [Deltaproteobacteria bacterium]MCB9787802.1 flagellar export chaperone FliS [Deltaproteobacteria bacterium]